jgi:hypothetical protein
MASNGGDGGAPAPASTTTTPLPPADTATTLATKASPHLAWHLAADPSPDAAAVAAKIRAVAAPEALGVTPEAPLGEPVRPKPRAGKAKGGEAAAAADEAAPAPHRTRSGAAMDEDAATAAEAAAAEAAVDAAGDGRDGTLG